LGFLVLPTPHQTTTYLFDFTDRYLDTRKEPYG
jgi:hypothetical protein